MTPSVFERHPKATLAGVWLVFLLLFVVVAELGLKQLSGLGRPVLFHAHPAYGYRLQPNQETWRFGGAHFKINNLGLRAREDWDPGIKDKILFLGDSVTYGGNHVSNHQLFSELAARGLPGLRSGNAGIPNWGVENVYGLVVQEKFLPASVYVTTFIEDDFYRGLTSGRNKPWIKYEMPRFALQELAEFVWHKYFADTREINRRERESEPADVRVARAAAKLKEMDQFLKARGHRHLIFISPTRQQALGQRPPDARVKAQLDEHGVGALYLLERLPPAPAEERRAWYQDNDHLTAKGHAVWGELIHEELNRALSRRDVMAKG
jgi:lysophospholipase L1-like esterase